MKRHYATRCCSCAAIKNPERAILPRNSRPAPVVPAMSRLYRTAITSTSATRTGSPISWCRGWRKGAYLLLLRDTQDVVLPAGIAVDWLRGAGLDGTVKARGLAVLTEADPVLDLPRRDERVRVFRPISENSAPTDDSVAAR